MLGLGQGARPLSLEFREPCPMHPGTGAVTAGADGAWLCLAWTLWWAVDGQFPGLEPGPGLEKKGKPGY